MNEQEQEKEKAPMLISFKKLIEAMEKNGLRVCDIHLEETGNPDTGNYKRFTGSIVIKTFPDNFLLNG